MAVRRYLQLDVFAERPGAGNPLGVVLDAGDMDSAGMQAYAAWANLSETIFFLPPSSPEADYRVRIFTPAQELPFAGHPSVGAAWAALEAGLASDRVGCLVQECAAGLLPIRIEREEGHRIVHVRTPKAHEVSTEALHALAVAAAIEGLALGKQPPALWNNGPNWWLVELESATCVRVLRPRLQEIAALTRASAAVGLAVFGRETGSDHDLAVRAFCPADGIAEDPVTGSANASIGALLRHAHAWPASGDHYVASQGRELGRDGRVGVRVNGDGEIWISGKVQAVIRGSVDW